MRPVAEAGYEGWLICEAEQDPAKAHPLTYARKGFGRLSATAAALGCSEGTVKSQTSHGLAALRTALGGSLDDLRPAG